MKRVVLLVLVLSGFLAYSQNKQTDKILEEGKLLFRLEKGSWHGTDHFLRQFSSKRDSIGGYLSYETDDNKICTIFFSRYDADKVLVRYTFDSLPRATPLKIDTSNPKASNFEKSLIIIREDAKNRANINDDGFFLFYPNTSLNLIPVIRGKERNVFVLTGPQVSGVVIIGNDYKLSYNKNNKFLKKEKIHETMLQFSASSGDKNNPTTTTIHSHILSHYISSTDICTLLLYKNLVEWKSHIVISEKEVSIFDMEKETLFTMKREAWDKIDTDNKKD